MTQDQVLQVFRESLLTMLELSAPFLIVSMVVGLLIAIFQAATQIHEQTITFVPKIIITVFLMLTLGSWMIMLLTQMFQSLCSMMISL